MVEIRAGSAQALLQIGKVKQHPVLVQLTRHSCLNPIIMAVQVLTLAFVIPQKMGGCEGVLDENLKHEKSFEYPLVSW
jgi:hypothetical protein